MEQGVMLVGAAAESWVKLQWLDFYLTCGFVGGFFTIVIIAAIIFYIKTKGD